MKYWPHPLNTVTSNICFFLYCCLFNKKQLAPNTLRSWCSTTVSTSLLNLFMLCFFTFPPDHHLGCLTVGVHRSLTQLYTTCLEREAGSFALFPVERNHVQKTLEMFHWYIDCLCTSSSSSPVWLSHSDVLTAEPAQILTHTRRATHTRKHTWGQ